MATKGGKAAEPPSQEEKLATIRKPFEKRMGGVLKLLAKKLKGVSKEAVYVLAMQLIEGQYAVDVHPGTPVYLDPKNGTVQELLTLATEEGFNKEQLEHCLAFIKSAAPAVLEGYFTSTRAAYLQQLSLAMSSNLTYTQAVSYKYSAGLKKIADLLARAGGGVFAKAWKPKAPASVFSKLVLRRGQVRNGWLADALQGRINCDSLEAVAAVAEFFRVILQTQTAAAVAAERPFLGAAPTGSEIMEYSLQGLLHPQSGLPVDQVATWLPDLSEEDKASVGPELIVVHRVKECTCCSEDEAFDSNSCIIVNLSLMRPIARRSGLIYRLPDQLLACTYELQAPQHLQWARGLTERAAVQISTSALFKRMAKGAETHERETLLQTHPLLAHVSAVVGGSQGKLAAAGAAPKGGAKPAGGDADAGRRLLDNFRGIEVTQPLGHPAKALAPPVPQLTASRAYKRRAAAPGSRWVTLWQSHAPVLSMRGVALRTAAKPTPLALAQSRCALLLSGVYADGRVEHLAEELLSRVPLVRGELQLVSEGLVTGSGQLLGALAQYSAVRLEYFEHERSGQWIELSDVSIRAVEVVESTDGGAESLFSRDVDGTAEAPVAD